MVGVLQAAPQHLAGVTLERLALRGDDVAEHPGHRLTLGRHGRI